MKLLIGIILGIIVTLSVGTVYAGNKTWDLDVVWLPKVQKIQDGNVSCYVVSSGAGSWGSISCVKVK